MTPATVLVTGGAGFIGSNIVADLASDPAFDVVVCDRLGETLSGKWRNLAKHPIADLIRPEQLAGWLDARRGAVDLVIHMGAVSSTLETDADKIIANNFALSRDLFLWCAEHGARLVYASSAATYGDGELGFDDERDPEMLRPLNPYGWSKSLFDQFVMRQARRGHAPREWTGLKFFNVYGPNEGHKGPMRSVISQIWPTVVGGGRISLFRSHRSDYEDGGQCRDFIYVRDVAECVGWLARVGGVTGIYNLGSGRARSFADLARAVYAAAGREPAIDYVDMPESMRHAYQYFTEAKMDKLRAAGWTGVATNLELGVADYVQNYLATPDPYR